MKERKGMKKELKSQRMQKMQILHRTTSAAEAVGRPRKRTRGRRSGKRESSISETGKEISEANSPDLM
jgi:hypothetical protein